MSAPAPIDIKRLASLLDDPDERVAMSAMAELIKRKGELGDIPAELQESPSPLMRQRIHLLQSVLILIERRRTLAELLQDPDADFIEAMTLAHLQWFDCDSPVLISKQLEDFSAELRKYPADDLAGIGKAFSRTGCIAVKPSTLKIETWCLGSILDERCGAAPVWCGMIKVLLGRGEIVRFNGQFGVMDGDMLLLPESGWRCIKVPEKSELEHWSINNLLHLVLSTFFSAAVNSDSLHYVLTFARTITDDESAAPLSLLTYPYNPEKKSN